MGALARMDEICNSIINYFETFFKLAITSCLKSIGLSLIKKLNQLRAMNISKIRDPALIGYFTMQFIPILLHTRLGAHHQPFHFFNVTLNTKPFNFVI